MKQVNFIGACKQCFPAKYYYEHNEQFLYMNTFYSIGPKISCQCLTSNATEIGHRPKCLDTFGTSLRSRALNLKSFLVTKVPKYKENGGKIAKQGVCFAPLKKLGTLPIKFTRPFSEEELRNN